jgi:hypothetical protein
MRGLTLTMRFCGVSQSFVSATKYENISSIFTSYKKLPSSGLSEFSLSEVQTVGFVLRTQGLNK